MRISDWSSDVCSSDLIPAQRIDGGDDGKRVVHPVRARHADGEGQRPAAQFGGDQAAAFPPRADMTCADVRTLAAAEGDDLSGMRPRMADQPVPVRAVERADRRSARSEKHTSELKSLMRISYAVFCF